MASIFDYYRERAKPVPAAVWRSPLYFIAFGFGSGASPFAPGTVGSLFALIFYLGLRELSLPVYLLFLVVFTAFSIWLLDKLSREMQVHDHPGMCLDEFVGMFVTLILAPTGFLWLLTGFALFRLFDILKPWPISWLDQHVHGGFGMVIDDVAAGLAAFLVLQGLYYFL